MSFFSYINKFYAICTMKVMKFAQWKLWNLHNGIKNIGKIRDDIFLFFASPSNAFRGNLEPKVSKLKKFIKVLISSFQII